MEMETEEEKDLSKPFWRPRASLWLAIVVGGIVIVRLVLNSIVEYSADDWIFVQLEANLDIISVNRVDGSVWVKEYRNMKEPHTLHVFSGVDQSGRSAIRKIPIEVEPGFGVLEICPSKYVSVVLNWKIARFDPQSTDEITLNDYLAVDSHWCSALRGGSIVFWSYEDIYIDNGESVTKLEKNSNNKIIKLAQSNDGKIWVLIDKHEIFNYEEGKSKGVFFASISEDLSINLHTIFIGTHEGKLWIGSDDKLITINTNNPEAPQEVIELEDIGQLLTLEEVTLREEIWIVGSSGIIIYQNGEMRSVPLPVGNPLINDADYDPTTNRLYIATVVGIFYLDLGGPP